MEALISRNILVIFVLFADVSAFVTPQQAIRPAASSLKPKTAVFPTNHVQPHRLGTRWQPHCAAPRCRRAYACPRRCLPHSTRPSSCLGATEGGDQSENSAADGIDAGKGIYGFDQEIVEREAAEAPFRKLRLVAYGLLAAIAVVLGGVSIAGMAGVDDVKELGENLPNPLLDAAVLGLAFYLWVEEVKTKRSALQIIKRRREEDCRVPNRTARRLGSSGRKKKAFGKKAVQQQQQQPQQQQDEQGQIVSDPLPSTSPSPSEDAEMQAGEPAPTEGGMFAGVRKTLEAVNQQSYYQAVALNKELEEKGVLPPLEREPETPGSPGVANSNAGDLVGDGDVSNVDVEREDAARREAAVVSEGGPEKRWKGKRGKKGKRKK